LSGQSRLIAQAWQLESAGGWGSLRVRASITIVVLVLRDDSHPTRCCGLNGRCPPDKYQGARTRPEHRTESLAPSSQPQHPIDVLYERSCSCLLCCFMRGAVPRKYTVTTGRQPRKTKRMESSQSHLLDVCPSVYPITSGSM